ncbi:hypothetical protein [Halorubrum sp. HHNYT27]|uniref:hypothetical protein n=1 Tax=Halorubrum sp. HHNYT27 TaxID=3402275 RepID=UPI003EBD6B45
MPIFGELSSLLSLAKDVKKSYDYWKNYSGEEIIIQSVEFFEMEGRIKHGITGTVDEVQSVPPGFILKDADEFYNTETFETGQYGIPIDGRSLTGEHHERIFISFDSIDRISFAGESREDETFTD